ncbi:MAG: 2Fe-2S iron-sulfur cluster-binding protein [Candidatus Korobacteraceae bacterium]|jgi:succinate dehydrogenase/fumarate reductase-like Fe-S protein
MDVQLKIFRFNPAIDTIPYYTSYTLPWTEGLTLLAAIRNIYTETDRTLAFRNYYCGRGLCGGCRVTVNGTVKKACHVVLEPRSYTVDPMKGYPVIRDLVVDFGIRRVPASGVGQIEVRQGAIIATVGVYDAADS